MKDNDWISEREYQHRLESLLKDSLNTQLRPLMSLESAEKEGGKQFWVHEINDNYFGLMVRPTASSTR